MALPCGRMMSPGHGFKYPCANLRPCPDHDNKPSPEGVSSAPQKPHPQEASSTPAPRLFEEAW